MIDRRSFIAGTAALAAAPAAAQIGAPATIRFRPPVPAPGEMPSLRPVAADRRFTSRAVEREIVRVSKGIADPKLRWMFGNCYPNTLDTTVTMRTIGGAPDAFVITGDIPCLWLRDSAAQLRPYLHLVRDDAPLAELFRGLIGRQARSVLIDPYANAFMEDPGAPTNLSWALADKTLMKPGVAERKWEIDSLCYFLRLSHDYWQATRDPRPFTTEWAAAARAVIATFRAQQRIDGPGPYRFQRNAGQPIETLLEGLGNPTRPNGMIHSMFRPSDDACLYSLFVPANLFAVTTLRELAAIAIGARGDAALASDAAALADEVERATTEHGRMRLADGSDVWAYEVDGFGNAVFMDDANVPSLLGLAFLGCVSPDDPRWQRTAAAVWSDRNPWFIRGRAAEGVGGPHVGRNQVWPMSMIVRAFSTADEQVIRAMLRQLRDTDGGTGLIHEAFEADDPSRFTREWFAWANGLFGQLIVHLHRTRPALLGAAL
ncbi:glycoside hydrolase family 125 protein [Sphingomonas sp. 37zxx]|uniref:glycoside hydrolase family 125 protein n=1 Tax=Sphingomonas sp. 37zxx TaxID=1550073 RepID=UPI00053BE2BB|nr:glycoside hydrolase family 125 protein [Sphingomonas sp. 37zxx]